MDTGSEPITDATELAWVRRRARAVHLKSLAVAVVLTAIVILI